MWTLVVCLNKIKRRNLTKKIGSYTKRQATTISFLWVITTTPSSRNRKQWTHYIESSALCVFRFSFIILFSPLSAIKLFQFSVYVQILRIAPTQCGGSDTKEGLYLYRDGTWRVLHQIGRQFILWLIHIYSVQMPYNDRLRYTSLIPSEEVKRS